MNANSSAAQNKKEPTVRCTKEALRVLKPFPALEYDCAENEDDSLKSPERKRGLRQQMKQLERFTSAEWWTANVEELNVCAAFKRPHVLTRSDYIAHAYPITLEGDSQTRLVISDDPCVKRSYGTLNAFVLQRAGEKVVITQVLDSYFSRADNAVSLSIADRGAERILEINVGSGGLNPYATSYLFTIDRATNRAVPWKKIKDGKKFTNEMTSCYALGVWEGRFDVEFPKSWQEMSIIERGKLANRFYVYSEGADNLERDTYIWNGSYYALQTTRGRKPHR